MSGEKILITHAQKVFNGKTIFKLSNSSVRVDTIILDDAHACIDTIKDSFSIVINRSNNKNLYEKFLVLFEEDLKFQREGSYLDIKNNSDDSVLAVPYWSWLNKKDSVLEILFEVMDYSPIKKKVQKTVQNTYFNERFGRSDFKAVEERSMLGEAVAYLTKYMEKTGEKMVYSKGLPQFFISDIMEEDIVCPFGLEDKNLLLYDDFSCWDEGCYMGQVSKGVIDQMRKCN